MNLVFTVIILVSVLLLIFNAPELVIPALSTAASKAVDLSVKLLAVYALWMGILKLCETTGLSAALARLLRPVIRALYGELPDDAAENLGINMAANLIGVGNAATPAALAAVRVMSRGKTALDYALIMLVVVNSTGLQLLPTSVISLRQAAGSANPSDIILPTIIASAAATAFGIIAVITMYRSELKKTVTPAMLFCCEGSAPRGKNGLKRRIKSRV